MAGCGQPEAAGAAEAGPCPPASSRRPAAAAPPRLPDNAGLARLAVELTRAVHEADVCARAARYLLSVLPTLRIIRFVHLLNTETSTVTVTRTRCRSRTRAALPARTSSAAAAIAYQQPLYAACVSPGDVTFTDWHRLALGAHCACFMTLPLSHKGVGVAALTLALSQPASLPRAGAGAGEAVAALVAPYLLLKDTRRSLQIAQSLLLASLPAQVVSHMLERQTLGMLPVLQEGGHVVYPRSDESDSDEAAGSAGTCDSSDEEGPTYQQLVEQQWRCRLAAAQAGPAAMAAAWPGGPPTPPHAPPGPPAPAPPLLQPHSMPAPQAAPQAQAQAQARPVSGGAGLDAAPVPPGGATLRAQSPSWPGRAVLYSRWRAAQQPLDPHDTLLRRSRSL